MKFSGWKASAPDAGLPPSMQSQGGQKASAGLGFRNPSSSATSISVGDARRANLSSSEASDRDSATNDHIMGAGVGGRTDSLHALDSVDFTPTRPGAVPIVPTTSSHDIQHSRDNSERSSRKGSGSF